MGFMFSTHMLLFAWPLRRPIPSTRVQLLHSSVAVCCAATCEQTFESKNFFLLLLLCYEYEYNCGVCKTPRAMLKCRANCYFTPKSLSLSPVHCCVLLCNYTMFHACFSTAVPCSLSLDHYYSLCSKTWQKNFILSNCKKRYCKLWIVSAAHSLLVFFLFIHSSTFEWKPFFPPSLLCCLPFLPYDILAELSLLLCCCRI